MVHLETSGDKTKTSAWLNGAPTNNYTVTATDSGHQISVQVTDTLRGYEVERRTSASKIASLEIMKTSTPKISSSEDETTPKNSGNKVAPRGKALFRSRHPKRCSKDITNLAITTNNKTLASFNQSISDQGI